MTQSETREGVLPRLKLSPILFCNFLFFCILQEEQHGWVPYKYKLVFNPNPANPKTRDFVTILPAPHLIHHYRQVITVVEFYSGGCEIHFSFKQTLKFLRKWTVSIFRVDFQISKALPERRDMFQQYER